MSWSRAFLRAAPAALEALTLRPSSPHAHQSSALWMVLPLGPRPAYAPAGGGATTIVNITMQADRYVGTQAEAEHRMGPDGAPVIRRDPIRTKPSRG